MMHPATSNLNCAQEKAFQWDPPVAAKLDFITNIILPRRLSVRMLLRHSPHTEK